MNINTDYAQYREWGLIPKDKISDEGGWIIKKDGSCHEREKEPKKDDTVKSNVTSPKWLKKGRARAKL